MWSPPLVQHPLLHACVLTKCGEHPGLGGHVAKLEHVPRVLLGGQSLDEAMKRVEVLGDG